MAETERTLDDDVYEWLGNAKQLLSEDQSEHALKFVHEHLEKMHVMLQARQYQAERRLDEQLKYERVEVDRFGERLALAEGGDDHDFSTTHDDLTSLWTSLHQNEWPAAFHALCTNKKLKEKDILDKLITILMKSYTLCLQRVAAQREDIMYRAKFPGTKPGDKTHQLPKDPPEELVDPSTYCQEKTVQFCIDTIKESISQELKQNSDLLKISKTKPDPGKTAAMERYLMKCVTFSWVASLEHNPVQLVINPGQDCKRLLADFPDHDLVSSKKRFVKWPAIVQDVLVKVPWELYIPGQEGQVPQSQDAPVGVPRIEAEEPRDKTDSMRTSTIVGEHHASARVSDTSQINHSDSAPKPGNRRDSAPKPDNRRESVPKPNNGRSASGSKLDRNARVVEDSGSKSAAQRPAVTDVKPEKTGQTEKSTTKNNKGAKPAKQVAQKAKQTAPAPAGSNADEIKRNKQTIYDI